MSSANSEQIKAIEHTGGVLLNAGAGAGKTFVLVEHIKYLIFKFLEEKKSLDEARLRFELEKYLASIVVMTFTNEAARELKTRIVKKFKGQEGFPFNIINDALPFLNVSTIHGFCLKIIKDGIVDKIHNEFDIYDQDKIDLKIESLVEKWFDQTDLGDLSDLFAKNYHSIISSMKKIFSSPELRVEWKSMTSHSFEFNEKEYFERLLEIENIKEVWGSKYDLSPYSDNDSTKWYQLINDFNNMSKDYTWSSLRSISSLMEKYPRVVSPKNNSEVKDFLDSLRKIKKLFSDNEENYDAFFGNFNFYKFWSEKLCHLFAFIEENYYASAGISFADLEYLVFSALSDNEEKAKIVQNKYSYLIVDEYQDTSYIQYEIIKKAIGGNFDKLFCVGDKKQAIYGFRGGEVGVFIETSKMTKKLLSLKSNYRSHKEIVDFNNQFFERTFALGKGFEGHDKYSVEVEHQVYPENKEVLNGHLEKLEVMLDTDKISNSEAAFIEADVFCSKIQKLLEETQDNICILYRTLKPSSFLIEKLIAKDISFEAQVKIPYSEDPTIVLFSNFIDCLLKFKNLNTTNLDKEIIKINNYFSFYIKGVLGHYGIKFKNQYLNLEEYYKKLDSLGVLLLFENILHQLGMANSMYANNLNVISEIITLNNGDIDAIWSYLNKIFSKDYSVKFYHGMSPRVKIMTTHASKGLQFDHVMLGGIHTNGKSPANSDFLGKMPGSMKWTYDLSRKKLFKSPAMILEEKIDALKEFSESKRLFYVAATRAIKSLIWADINTTKKPFSFSPDSWIHPLRSELPFAIGGETINFSIANSEMVVDNSPLYFKDALGISLGAEYKNGLISELSVTNLSEISICSRKFYLSQLLKLDEDWEALCEEKEIMIPSKRGVSSADRGNRLHYAIENYLAKKSIDKEFEEYISWFSRYLESKKYDQLLVEEEMKFLMFGQMITGRPDLVLKSGKVFEVIDYKSGLVEESDQLKYFFQLMVYAVGCATIFEVDPNTKVKLSILAFDEKRVLEREDSIAAYKKEIFNYWSELDNFSHRKIDYCAQCLYGNLCH